MIVTNLIGGLGNQMFQYACARALAVRQQRPLRVALDMFAGYTLHHGFELHRVFMVETPIASSTEMRAALGWRTAPALRRLIGKLPASVCRGSGFIAGPHYSHWPQLDERATGRAACYLQGYWQSEKYFADQADLIREEFRFRLAMSPQNEALARQIAACDSVSVHVRRGDYVTNAKAMAVHGACEPMYYERAIALIIERVPQARLFAFSDDAQWVSDTLQRKHPTLTIVQHNQGAESYNDMRLMSLCRHHIIANSSFSWWGAWLDPSSDKTVIAPKRWFANGRINHDLIPASWIQL